MTPAAIDAAIDAAKSLSEPLSGAGEADVLRTVTVNIGMVSAGLKINLVPDRATAEVDVRLPVGVGTESCLAEVRRLLSPLAGIELEVLRRFEPTVTDPGHEIFRRIMDNAQEVMGRRRGADGGVWSDALQPGRAGRARHARRPARPRAGLCAHRVRFPHRQRLTPTSTSTANPGSARVAGRHATRPRWLARTR